VALLEPLKKKMHLSHDVDGGEVGASV